MTTANDTTTAAWLAAIERVAADKFYHPVAFDSSDREVCTDWFDLPSDEEILAELAEVPLPVDEDEDCRAEERDREVKAAIDAICQRQYREREAQEDAAIEAAAEAHEARLAAFAARVADALRIDLRRRRWDSSTYFDFHGWSLRISDHEQKPGGGFCMFRGEQMGEADLHFLLEELEDATMRELRDHAAATIRELR